jgi:hypothetical protein
MNHPFDEFSKSLSEESVPRRESLRRLGAAFLAAVLAPLAIEPDSASANPDTRPRRRRGRRLIQRNQKGKPANDACTAFCKRCHGRPQRDQCLTACRQCGNDPTHMHGTCGAYACCPAGTTYCSGTCVFVNSDTSNCGACGRACGGSTPYCINGTCTDCAPGQTKCNGTCTDLYWDPANCGACGNDCSGSTTPYCEWGTCVECPYYMVKCDGVCTDIWYDPNNCGACNVRCENGCYEGYCY